eukprot:362967-Chlamydomonas_euryale.AAC.4
MVGETTEDTECVSFGLLGGHVCGSGASLQMRSGETAYYPYPICHPRACSAPADTKHTTLLLMCAQEPAGGQDGAWRGQGPHLRTIGESSALALNDDYSSPSLTRCDRLTRTWAR